MCEITASDEESIHIANTVCFYFTAHFSFADPWCGQDVPQNVYQKLVKIKEDLKG